MFELCVLSQKFASTIENKDTSDLTYRTVLSSANIFLGTISFFPPLSSSILILPLSKTLLLIHVYS